MINRSFTIDPVTFEPDHTGNSHYVRWGCRLCQWNGRTDPRPDRERVQEDTQEVASRHGYGTCVP